MKTERTECEKYELAITNYVLGEEMGITKEELFNHLRTCPNCREDLKDWQATHSVMRAEAYDSRPEVKARSEALIKELASQPLPAGPPTDVKAEIDSAAGKIYDYLKSIGETLITDLREKTGLVDYPFYEAMSWLVMNDKAIYTKGQDNRPIYASPR